MNYFEFYNPVKICAGNDAICHLEFELSCLKIKKPLILTGSTLVKTGVINKIIKTAKIKDYILVSDIPADSGVKLVNNILNTLIENKCDGIIAIGGGSVIDTSKGVKMSFCRTDNLKEIMGLESISKNVDLPLIVLPTTAGTGSEVTNVAVIRDEQSDLKMEFITPFLMPNVAILDPSLTTTLPAKTTASTGMDALTHAIEGYSCLQKNPMSDAYAITAIKLIFENLEIACKEPNNLTARTNMLIASTLAGLCFGNSMVGGVHAIGHALGSVCHISHGDAMTILLPHVMEFNKDVLCKEYSDLASIIFASQCAQMSMSDKCDYLIKKIYDLRNNLNLILGVPISLTQTNKYDKLNEKIVAKSALNDGAIILNPKTMDLNNVISILNESF